MQGQPGSNVQLDSAQKRKYVIIFILKGGLGIILLILGGLAAKNTQGQTDTFGPPYFIGAYIVGVALIVAGLLNMLLYRRVIRDSAASTLQKDVAYYTCGEVGFSVVAIMGGFIGLFFVGIFGVPECDPRDFFSHCNYTENISENRSIAIAILIFILLSEIVVIGTVVIHCRACRGIGPYSARSRTHYGITTQHQTYTTSGPANVVVTTAPEQPHYSGGRHGYGQNYDFNSRDTQIIVGGQVIDIGQGGFQGAVLSQPENVTIVHPPMGYPQYTDQSRQNTGAQGYQTSSNVNDLQEQNRLLREQIALQQQQLNLMQQQQQQQARAPSPNLPPPPSYDSCIQDPVKINLLEEQNRELQNKYYVQQQQLHDMTPPGGENIQPSAPPM